ncbi:MAG TPA: hypothetical protein VE338_13370 [Ktedonobacterales bacterium]|nr:hypothetical protein [Ktedonobacterales bacterium]
MGIHWYDGVLAFLFILPIIVGALWVAPDATRRGQPGWLWALLTIPFGWLAVIVYAALRMRYGPLQSRPRG